MKIARVGLLLAGAGIALVLAGFSFLWRGTAARSADSLSVSQPPSHSAAILSTGENAGANSASSSETKSVLPSAADAAQALSQPATAFLQAGGKNYRLQANQQGGFEQIPIEAKTAVPITVHYENGEPGEVVAAQVLDGGALKDGKHIADVVALDEQGNIALSFTSGDQRGIYRVRLMKGGDFKTLNFWVGPPLKMRSVATR